MTPVTFERAAAGRSPDTQAYAGLFDYAHLPDRLARVSAIFHDAAVQLLGEVADGPQLVWALQELVRAKDSAVRQAVLDQRAADAAARPLGDRLADLADGLDMPAVGAVVAWDESGTYNAPVQGAADT